MRKVDLQKYQLIGLLGSGADYEVRAALDRETGQQVVLKRPMPQMVSRQLHRGIEERTDRILQVYEKVGHAIPHLSPILGYTDRACHDEYFRESLGQEYRVMVEVRARGIPLVGDPMARITGVPVGVGQNLFTLFPLAHPDGETAFAVHQQLLDLEEKFFQGGYVLLDLRPQNVFFQPASGRISVIDIGALHSLDDQAPKGRQPRDIHDFYLEMLKFYTTPQRPPAQVGGYREPYGLRPVINFREELDSMARSYQAIPDPAVCDTALPMIARVRDRAYAGFGEFRQDLTAYLESVRERNRTLPNLRQARGAWTEALDLLRADYWRRYLFDPDAELAGLEVFG